MVCESTPTRYNGWWVLSHHIHCVPARDVQDQAAGSGLWHKTVYKASEVAAADKVVHIGVCVMNFPFSSAWQYAQCLSHLADSLVTWANALRAPLCAACSNAVAP